MKIVYLFESVTGELIGTYEAQESPLEEGEYIVPEHSTQIEPPTAGAGLVAVFSAGAWSLQPDHRGSVWYDQAGNSVEITGIGIPDQSLSPALPTAIALAHAQTDCCNALAGAYNAEIQKNVQYMGTEFQADDASQTVLTKVLVAGSVPEGFFWLDANNVQVPMSYAQLQGLAGAILVRAQAAFIKLQQLKATVRSAASVDEVHSVVW